MNYKTLVFNCGCKYVYITDKEKQILKAHKFCPDHPKVLKKQVVLYCIDCGLKMTETGLLSWQRKMRCEECRIIDQKKRTKENLDKKAKKYNAKRRKTIIPIDFVIAKRAALRRLYRSMELDLPIVETPMIDNL